MANPSVLNVYPANAAQGIVIGDQVEITFDQEMDLDSINTGTIVVSGPDQSPVFGPLDVTPLDAPDFDDEDILSSPSAGAYVKGRISFSRVDENGYVVSDNVVDEDAEGDLWRTVAVFTPETPLPTNVEFTCFVLGEDTGVKSRTVFDTVKLAGSGTAKLLFKGGYTGALTKTYLATIITGGPVGEAVYEWWDESDPLDVFEHTTTTGDRELENGIYVICDPDGEFIVGDRFSVIVKPPTTMDDTYRWTFITGSGSIVVPPSTSSTTGPISTDGNNSVLTGTGVLTVTSITPSDGETNLLPTSVEEIVIKFNKNIESSTVTDDTILVNSESVNGDPQYTATGVLSKIITVSGNTITLQIDSVLVEDEPVDILQLLENNLVTVTLSEDITATDGTALGEEETYYFTTTYNPLYSSIRRVRLDLGPVAQDIADDTINLAIFEASLNANLYDFTSTKKNQDYFVGARREYVSCLAELILLNALLGDTSLANSMKKSLGNLSVARTGGPASLSKRVDDARKCVEMWRSAVTSGGLLTPGSSVLPGYSVKGVYADDAIVVARQWRSPCGVGRSGANHNTYSSGRRDQKTYRPGIGGWHHED